MRVPAPLTLLVCAALFVLCAESHTREFFFVEDSLSWSEAQQFCRKHYHDLAMEIKAYDFLTLPRPPGYPAPVWIGLYDNPLNLSQWTWSATDSSTAIAPWKSDEPDYIHTGLQCVSGHTNGWTVWPCSSKYKAICYSGSNPKNYHHTAASMNWFEAKTYCRTHHTDLALIESEEENKAALFGSKSYLWIGLSRISWRWSDGRSLSYTKWQSANGNRFFDQVKYCAAENSEQLWDVHKCTETHTFYCQGQLQEENIVKIKFEQKIMKIKFSGHILDASMIKQKILEKIQKRFEEEGHTDVKIKWKSAPKKQEE